MQPLSVKVSSLSESTKENKIKSSLLLLLAVSAGIIVSNLFASQPIVAEISASIGMPSQLAGLVSTLTMLGYATGVVFLLPLTDRLENRRLILGTLTASVLALLGASYARGAATFLCAVFLVGVTSCTLQMVVVMVATLCDESERGKVVGTVMSGVMVGGLLCRPAGVLLSAASSWRSVYLTLAIFSAALLFALSRVLPVVQPTGVLPYLESLKSLGPLLARVPVLRRRASYQAAIMVSFGAFWTSIPWRLIQPPFTLGPRGVAIFAFVAVGSAIIAPVAGQAGDRGLTRSATIWAHSAVVAGAILAAYAGASTNTYAGSIGTWWVPLGLMAVAAMFLDTGVVADQALGRRAVNMVRPEARGRINGLFTSSFFVGQALGAALARPAWMAGGWVGVCVLILVPALVAFALHLGEPWAKASEPLETAFPADW